MAKKSQVRSYRASSRVFGFILVLIMLGVGLFLGAVSTLTLSREADGSVTAVNAWRFADRLTLLTHKVTRLRDVKMHQVSLSEEDRRSSAYRDAFGRLTVPEELQLIGDGTITYAYHDDQNLIRGFLQNVSNKEAVLTHPVDIRCQVGSWVLLGLGGLSLLGFAITLVMGRDPLAGSERKVKPLPPAVGASIFLGGLLFCFWFLRAGHHVFGPVATSKVKLLMDSAKQNDADGIASAVRKGVFIDVRDEQSMTALMIAARAGAIQAVDALLKAGANPSLRDLEDTTALVRAIEMHKSEIAMHLIAAESDLNAGDADGRTALHHAAEAGDSLMVYQLLKKGGNANQPDGHGWTPLIFAASSGSAEAVSALLDAGADPHTKLPDGRTAVDLAQSNAGLREVLAKAAGAN